MAEEAEEEAKSDEYSKEMQEKMGSSLVYRHEQGMNFAHVLDDLIVGSCLQTPQDLDRLVEEEGVGTIMCLQQDSDMAYFDLDIAPIVQRAAERGDVQHIRHEIRDFDPFSLRQNLPEAVRVVARAFAQGRGKFYIHCTAGMGRAPALVLAYMFWCRGFELQAAYQKLYSVRPCNPKLFAIREATCDLLYGAQTQPAAVTVLRQHPDSVVEAAGLDVGWGQRIRLEWDAARRAHRTERQLLPGRYQYKLIFDERWSYDADHPTLQDGGNVNNFLDVPRSTAHAAECSRLMQDDAALTREQRTTIEQLMTA